MAKLIAVFAYGSLLLAQYVPPAVVGSTAPLVIPTSHLTNDLNWGPGITSGTVNGSNHLVLTLSDGTTKDVGAVVGQQGPQGVPGVAGAAGQVGTTGAQGVPGSAGTAGLMGATGSPGPAGAISVGSTVSQTNMSTAMSAQTICPATSACPAGIYTVEIGMVPLTAGTLVSAVTPGINFNDGAARSLNFNTAMSLVQITSAGSYSFTFYHAANTVVSVYTTTTALSGSPTYSLYARML